MNYYIKIDKKLAFHSESRGAPHLWGSIYKKRWGIPKHMLSYHVAVQNHDIDKAVSDLTDFLMQTAASYQKIDDMQDRLKFHLNEGEVEKASNTWLNFWRLM